MQVLKMKLQFKKITLKVLTKRTKKIYKFQNFKIKFGKDPLVKCVFNFDMSTKKIPTIENNNWKCQK